MNLRITISNKPKTRNKSHRLRAIPIPSPPTLFLTLLASLTAPSPQQAVVSNATPFDTIKMLKPDTQQVPEGVIKWRDELGKLPRHGAIMHLFLAIDAKDLDLSHIQVRP